MTPITCKNPALKPLFDALGINPNRTTRVIIDIGTTDQVVKVNVETVLNDLQGQVISELVSSHILVERKIP